MQKDSGETLSNLFTDQKYLRREQYRNASNLNARIQLHQRFSTNQYGWMPWLFDQLDLPPACHVLELGCGPGDLWLENISRLPEDWGIVLSDFSAGMVHQARRNLCHSRHPFRYAIVDAQAIPFPDRCFDAVIANHMLYHVPDRAKALSEIRRVLRPGGCLYASTVGKEHLKELRAFTRQFCPKESVFTDNPFTLENGMAQLTPWFSNIAVHRYKDDLKVTEVAPLVEYVTSGRANVTTDQRIELTGLVARELASRGGVIRIFKDSGIFVAFRQGDL